MQKHGVAEVRPGGGFDLILRGKAVVEPQRHVFAARGDEAQFIERDRLRQGQGERLHGVGLVRHRAVKAQGAGLRCDGQAERRDHVHQIAARPGDRGIARAGAGDGGLQGQVAIAGKHQGFSHGENLRTVHAPGVGGGEAHAADHPGAEAGDDGGAAGIGEVGTGLVDDDGGAALGIEDFQFEAHRKAEACDDGGGGLGQGRDEDDAVGGAGLLEAQFEPAHVLLGGVAGLQSDPAVGIDQQRLGKRRQIPIIGLQAGIKKIELMPGPEGEVLHPARVGAGGGSRQDRASEQRQQQGTPSRSSGQALERRA